MRRGLIKAGLCGAAGAVLFALFIFARATWTGPRPEDRTGPVVRIVVARTGAITADGEDSSLARLEPVLKRLKAEDGTVWYHCEGGAPPAEMMRVIKLVVDHGVAISLSSRRDFSDYVDKDGRSHPRKPR